MKLILVAFVFHMLDLASGLLSAFKTKTLCSSKMRDGMFKKIAFLFCYAIGLLLDNYGCAIGFNCSFAVTPLLVFYTTSTECVSILENVHKINPEILPDKIKSLLKISGE